jgi:nickel/cobalt transporter (NicO) family protein
MTTDLTVLAITAASIGFFHTLLGPDHYLPFIVMGRAQGWTWRKTTALTLLCGAGHVLSSVVLGLIGVGLGIAVTRVEGIESVRGALAAWALIAFGLAYFAWGLKRALKNRPHTHAHVHVDGTVHQHKHVHAAEHAHAHGAEKSNSLTPWLLFVVFVLGPCEPLIPLLMYPAVTNSFTGMLGVTLIFGATTMITMTAIVAAGFWGLRLVPLQRFERYTHALAGAAICVSGLAIQFLGL